MNCPQCGIVNPKSAQRCDCGYDLISQDHGGPDSAVRANVSLSKVAVGTQVVALVLTGAAAIWGCVMVYIARNPGDSGEFGGFSVLFAAVVDIPLGLLSLLVGLAVKRGYPALRWVNVVLSVAVLALPFVARAVWQSQFRVR